MSGDFPKLGPCCGCETTKGVRNVVMLDRKSPLPGKGWGCVVCGLPSDGAIAVLCDFCQERARITDIYTVLRFACRGYPGKDGRIPIAELTGRHQHDMTKH